MRLAARKARQPLADRNGSSKENVSHNQVNTLLKATKIEVQESASGIPVIDQEYRIIRKLGEGSYGVVVAAESIKRRKKVAIKKISNAVDDEQNAIQLLRELKLLRHFSGHENVINILDIIVSPKSSDSSFKHLFIVTDLMDTDLHRIIRSPQALSPDHVRFFTYQILRAMKFIHSAQVMHRDLKPSNILVNANCDLKICDLGLARVDNLDLTRKSIYVVTRWYRAPELLLGNDKYGCGIDMWSVGCILAELLGRQPLFPGSDYVGMLRMIVNACGSPNKEEYPAIGGKSARFLADMPSSKGIDWSQKYRGACPQALSLLERLLQINPAKRITAKEAIHHPFLLQLHDPHDEPDSTVCDLFDFDENKLSTTRIRQLIAAEARLYRDQE